MEIIFSVRHGDLGNEFKEYAQDKLDAILEGRPLKLSSVRVVLDIQKARHKAEIIVNLKNNSFEADSEMYEMHAAIDAAVDKIETQITRYLDKVQDHHKTHKKIKVNIDEEAEEEDEFYEEVDEELEDKVI